MTASDVICLRIKISPEALFFFIKEGIDKCQSSG